jgi:coatomer protein complex subunit alpha (xenin)
MHMVKHSRLCGRSIVAYLQDKGFPEVALHFVREPKTRFRLALACGDIEAAMESAFALERQAESGRDIWGELGNEALRQGNHQVVEMSYQRTKDFDRLSFLYLISGDTEKLRKMLKISQMRNDIMGRYHNALLLGDAAERVSVLEASGNLPLAYMCAKLHGLAEDAERILIAIETNKGDVEAITAKANAAAAATNCTAGRLLQPPTPIFREANWPTLEVRKSTLADLSAAAPEEKENYADASAVAATTADLGAAEPWDDGDADGGFGDDVDAGPSAALAAGDDLDFGDDWGDELGDLGDELDLGGPATAAADDMDVVADDSGFQMPPSGRPPAGCWVANSSHASDHVAAGGMSSALQLLNRQIAASDFNVLKESMMGCYLGSMMSVPGIPGSGSMPIPLLRNDAGGHPGPESLPRTYLYTKDLVNGIKNGYRFFQGGKFGESHAAFVDVLTKIPLVVTENRQEESEIKEMMSICREYITAIRVKNAMAQAGADPVRGTELAAYFTHCNVQPVHLLLALRSAMGTAFKHKNYIVAASFARRLLELPDMSSEKNADLKVKATKVRQKSEQMARNEHQLNYDESKTFAIDCRDFVPIYAGQPSTQCSYCGSQYADEGMNNQICLTCNFCVVGIKTLGLVTG